MEGPIYVSFYTAGLYEREAARLRGSLDALGLPHDIREVADKGGWLQNTRQTPDVICAAMGRHPFRPVVYLDSDAVVWEYPRLFDELAAGDLCDVAVHYRKGTELLNGTVYFAPTSNALRAAWRYAELIGLCPGETSEQRLLARALDELKSEVRVLRLPASYCWIHDVMAQDMAPGERAVIEHLQASRETHRSHLTEQRRKRLAEIGDRLKLIGVPA